MKIFSKIQRFLIQRPELSLVIIFTVIGAFLRLYNIQGTLQFLGDQGRDALIARAILIDKDPVLIGPVTSVGNMYLGPLYYYFMVPFLALTYPSPMGPVYAVAIIGILTIPAIYFLGRELVGRKAAMFAAVLYSVTWTYIETTRFSWNPNPAPLVSLVLVWAIHRAWTKSAKYWMVVSLTFSLLLQLHYLTLLAGAAAGTIWLADGLQTFFMRKKDRKKFIISSTISFIIFGIFLIPLIVFDLRHQFLNLRAFQNLLFGQEDQIRTSGQLLATILETHGRSLQIFFETTIGQNRLLNTVLLAGLAAIVVRLWLTAKKYRSGIGVLATYVVVGIVGTAMYRSTVFDHYIAYLFPVAALFLGLGLSLFSKSRIGFLLAMFLVGSYVAVNIVRYNYQDLSWTISEIRETSYIIQSFIEPDEKYNVVLLASHGDIEALNYRYFLTTTDHPPLVKERWGEVDTLVVINEDRKLKNVADSPVYEIVVFPNKRPYQIINIPDGPEITFFKR